MLKLKMKTLILREKKKLKILDLTLVSENYPNEHERTKQFYNFVTAVVILMILIPKPKLLFLDRSYVVAHFKLLRMV